MKLIFLKKKLNWIIRHKLNKGKDQKRLLLLPCQWACKAPFQLDLLIFFLDFDLWSLNIRSLDVSLGTIDNRYDCNKKKIIFVVLFINYFMHLKELLNPLHNALLY